MSKQEQSILTQKMGSQKQPDMQGVYQEKHGLYQKAAQLTTHKKNYRMHNNKLTKKHSSTFIDPAPKIRELMKESLS